MSIRDQFKKKNSSDSSENNNRGLGGGSFIRWIYIIIIAFIVFNLFFNQSGGGEEITWTAFKQEYLPSGDVEKITVINKEQAEVYIREKSLEKEKYKDLPSPMFSDGAGSGPHLRFQIGSIEKFEEVIDNYQEQAAEDEQVTVEYETQTDWFSDILIWVLPLFLFIIIWIAILRSSAMGRAGGKIFNFGQSTAKLFEKGKTSEVTFDDVAGLEEAKVEIMEIVDFLKNPEHYTRLGAKIPKGVMLVGPPGTGKTLLAKAVAGEAQVPFFSLSGSEFVEMFVGVGASRVRDLFKKAKEKSPSIIFIDEIDAIGRSRGAAQSMQSNDERESTLNQMLTEMDGFGENTGVIVLAATNRADILDPALLRPGRFDRHIYLELPNKKERMAIFKVHMRELQMSDDVNVEALASQTPGFSGADIANICNEAALIAARRKKEKIEWQDFMDATERIIGGLEKKSKIISPSEKKIIAFHESGHATVSWYLKNVDSILKVSIVPRGKSLGAAWYLPEEHQIMTKSQFMDQICAALGGRAAEDVVFGEVSSGALNDLEKVTKQAYTMVSYYGLDEKLGNISYFDSSGQYERSLHKPYSESTAKLIDDQVRQLVEKAYERTKRLLREHRDKLDTLAERLLEKEVVHKEELEEIFGKRPDEDENK